MGKLRMTTKEFIQKSREIHGDKYDYSKSVYNGSKNKTCIICKKHGEFWQKAYIHLKGSGCIKCFNEEKRGKSRQHDANWFIQKAKEIHGNKYDY